MRLKIIIKNKEVRTRHKLVLKIPVSADRVEQELQNPGSTVGSKQTRRQTGRGQRQG